MENWQQKRMKEFRCRLTNNFVEDRQLATFWSDFANIEITESTYDLRMEKKAFIKRKTQQTRAYVEVPAIRSNLATPNRTDHPRMGPNSRKRSSQPDNRQPL